MNSSFFERRLTALLVLFISCLGLLMVRLFYLQVIRGDSLRIIAEANRTSLVFERAPRGLILDRSGLVLADSKPTFVVLFTPLELKKEVFTDVIRRLAVILNIAEDDLKRRLQPALKHSSMVRVMDRATLPRPRKVKTLDTTPPGMSEIKIKPMPMPGSTPDSRPTRRARSGTTRKR